MLLAVYGLTRAQIYVKFGLIPTLNPNYMFKVILFRTLF